MGVTPRDNSRNFFRVKMVLRIRVGFKFPILFKLQNLNREL